MKIKKFIITSLLLAISIAGEAFAVQLTSLDMGDCLINQEKIGEIVLKNDETTEVQLVNANIIAASNAFSILNFYPAKILPNEMISIPIRFFTDNNIRHDAFLVVRLKTGNFEYSVVANLTANAIHTNSIYSPTNNLKGAALLTWMQNFVKPHTVYSYKEARTFMWGGIDNVNGEVECIYTGRKVQTNDIPDVTLTKFNTEHTWPQAYGADSEPPKSDLYHMRPSYEIANSKRASLPFGFVAGTPQYEDGGSKLGINANGTLVFEPRDLFKGDIARGLYYFATRYGNVDNFISSQEDDLKKFIEIDPVDAKEASRADSVVFYQKNHNPYIEYPIFIHRFNRFNSPDFTPKSQIDCPDDTVFVLNTQGLNFNVSILNYGDAPATVSNASLVADNDFEIVTNITGTNVNPNGTLAVPIKYKGTAENAESKLNLSFSDGTSQSVVLISKSIILGVGSAQPVSFDVYPNPIVDYATLTLNEASAVGNISVAAYTIEGKSLEIFVNSSSNSVMISKNQLPCSHCTLYLVLNNNGKRIIKPVVVE